MEDRISDFKNKW